MYNKQKKRLIFVNLLSLNQTYLLLGFIG